MGRGKRVLGGDDDGIDANRFVVIIIFHSDLSLSVGTQIIHQLQLPDLRQTLCQLMGKRDGKRHQFRCLVTGITEHHALIPGSVIQLVIVLIFGFQ